MLRLLILLAQPAPVPAPATVPAPAPVLAPASEAAPVSEVAPDPDHPEERAIRLMEALATLIDEDKHDCVRMGDRVNAFMDAEANRQTIRDIEAFSARLTPKQLKASEAKYGSRARQAGEKMMGGVMKCMTNERVKAGLAKMKP